MTDGIGIGMLGHRLTDAAHRRAGDLSSAGHRLTDAAHRHTGGSGSEVDEEEWQRQWLQLLPSYRDPPGPDPRTVRKLLSHVRGAPDEFRAALWLASVGNRAGVTRQLFEAHLQAGSSSDASPHQLAMIEADLHRTFADQGLFAGQGRWADALRSVLVAYSHFRPVPGYVQGMSFLAAMLLIYTDAGGGTSQPATPPPHDEDGDQPLTLRDRCTSTADIFRVFPAFSCLANLLEHPARILRTCLRLDSSRMSLLFEYWQEELLARSLPRLYAHFKELGVEPQMCDRSPLPRPIRPRCPPRPVSSY